MADNENNNPSGDELPPEGTPPAEEVATVPKEDFDKLQKQITEQMEMLSDSNRTNNDLIQQMNSMNAVPPAATPSVPDLTGADIDNMVAEGQGGDKILAGLNRTVQNKIDNLVKTHIDPMRAGGTDAISYLTKKQMGEALPHFKRYTKEIDEQLKLLAPEQRANPQTIEGIYNYVVGKHSDELVKEGIEASLRKEQDNTATLSGGSTGSRGTGEGGENEIAPEDILSDSALALLERKKITPEQHAQQLGFKTFTEFAQSTEKGKRNAKRASK